MQNTELENMVNGTLQALAAVGFKESTLGNYRKVFARLAATAQELRVSTLTPALEKMFIQDTRNTRTGEYCHSRACFHAIAIRYLKDYMKAGKVDWNYNLPRGTDEPETEIYRALQEKFLLYMTEKGLKPNTLDSYRNVACKFLRFCEANGLKAVSDIREQTVPAFFTHLGETWDAGSYRTAAAGLRSFLQSDADLTRLAIAVPKHLTRKREIIPVLTDSQQQVLWETLQGNILPARDRAIVALFLVSGLRATDVCGLKLRDVDWARDTIHIIQSKTGNSLNLPLLPGVGNILLEYVLHERPKSSCPNLFLKCSAPYTPLKSHTSCRAIVDTVFKSAGIDPEAGQVGSRLLRHNAASKLLAAGTATQVISSMLGHVDPLTADVYLTTERRPLLQCVLSMPAHCDVEGR